jgi:hypothetical protein
MEEKRKKKQARNRKQRNEELMEMKQEGKGKKVERREKHGEGKRGWMENGQEDEIEMRCYAVA